MLVHPDITKPYRLYTDASDYAVGAILAQEDEDGNERVIHYLSQQLSRTQRKWPTLEKEGWAIVLALKKFRQYLLGAPVTVFTDHKPLRLLFSSEFKNARVQRWGILISEYQCTIQYREGKKMKADFVSRIRGPIPDDNDAQEAAEEDLCFDYPSGEPQGPQVEEPAAPDSWPFRELKDLEADCEEEMAPIQPNSPISGF